MEHRPNVDLSERERQIVELAAEGHTDTSIAHELRISEATVATYWSRVRMKIGPFSRPELVARIVRLESSRLLQEVKSENQELVKELEKCCGEEWGEGGANFYQQLLREAPDPILIVNEEGMIESANEEAERLFGFTRSELEGSAISKLIPDRYRLIHSEHLRDYIARPERKTMADHSLSLAIDNDGKEFPIAATLSPVVTPTGTHVMCIIRAAPRHFYNYQKADLQAR